VPNAPRTARADVGTGVGGRTRIALFHPDGGSADFYAHGGQVLSWRPPRGEDVLFLSANIGDRQFAHGGVPVVFPQFGSGELPQHGFARASEWAIGERSADGDGSSVATMSLGASPATRQIWPHEFQLELVVALGRTLTMTLRATNYDPGPLTFTVGLHTYFRVRDVRRTAIGSLSGLAYRDKTRDFAESVDSSPTLVPKGETDRVYLGAPPVVRISDGERVIRVGAAGFGNIVVWNPGPAGDARFDFVEGEWTKFVCVEPATITSPVVLEPGATWEGTQTVSVEA
jgi:glucose-6-phosphate 1-epimerase